MKLKARDVKALLKDTFKEWSEDKAPKMAAALAYYAVFSLGPLLLIAIAVASVFFGQEAARSQLHSQISSLVGASSANTIAGIMQNFQDRQSQGAMASVGVVVLLITASGVFAELRDSLNRIWEVKPAKLKGVRGMVKKRVLSFGMVFAIGFLLLVSLILTSLLEIGLKYMGDLLPGAEFIWQIVSFAVTFGMMTLLFASMFRYLPDARIAWRDLWIGSAITALFFTLGKFGISLYLAHSATASAFGAAGSLIVLLLWIYFSAQIFFFGAEFTQTYANSYGSGIVPLHGAVSLNSDIDQIFKRKESMMKTPHVHAKSTKRQIRSFDDAITAVNASEQPLKNEIYKARLTVANLLRAKKYYILGSAALAVISYVVKSKRRKHAETY